MGLRFDQARTPSGPRSIAISLDAARRAGRSRPLEIGIVNNMPDAALRATERHYAGLIAATGSAPVRLHFFAVPEIARGDGAAAHLEAHYREVAALDEVRLDGLIVTGMEPRAPLPAEPYWSRLTGLIDWAEHNTISSIFSCLAAHALVLHLDGIERRALATKRFGVFDFTKRSDSPLLAGMPAIVPTPHSRWNEVVEADLTSCGYQILTSAPDAGVDIFVKPMRSLFVCLQGHPEYQADTLLREYRRDLHRFLRGETRCRPVPPFGYFDAATEAQLATCALAGRRPTNMDDPGFFALETAIASLRQLHAPQPPWREAAVTLMRNWLAYLTARKG